jgi:hypothetical protein
MKRIYLIISSLFLYTLTLSAQAPQGVNYQAVIRDDAGEIVANEGMTILVAIRDGPNGDPVYREQFTGFSTDEYGLLQFVVGRGAALNIPFFLIDWSQGQYYLKIDLRLDSGIGIDLPATPFQSVPYALMAETIADPLWERGGGNSAALLGDRVGIGTTIPDDHLEIRDADAPGLRLRADGTGSPHLDLISESTNNPNSSIRLSKEGIMFRIRTSSGLPADNSPLLFSLDGLGRLGLGVAEPTHALDLWGVGDRFIRLRGFSTGIEFSRLSQAGQDFRFVNDDGRFSLSRRQNSNAAEVPIFLVEESGRFRLQQELNMDDQRIVNVADPEGPQQVVNVRYLEDFVGDVVEQQSLFPEGLSSEATNMTFDGCANRCRTLTEGGFSNWGVPSLDQFSQFAGGSVGDPSMAWTSTGTSSRSSYGYAYDNGLANEVIEVQSSTFIGRFTMRLNTGEVGRAERSERMSCRCVR